MTNQLEKDRKKHRKRPESPQDTGTHQSPGSFSREQSSEPDLQDSNAPELNIQIPAFSTSDFEGLQPAELSEELKTHPLETAIAIPDFTPSEFRPIHPAPLEKSVKVSRRNSGILIPLFSLQNFREMRPVELSREISVSQRPSSIAIPNYFVSTFRPLKPYVLVRKPAVQLASDTRATKAVEPAIESRAESAELGMVSEVKSETSSEVAEVNAKSETIESEALTATAEFESGEEETGEFDVERVFGGIGKLVDRYSALILVPRYRFGDVEVSFAPILAAVCSELYRIHSGGTPKVVWHSTDAKEEVEEFLSAEGSVYVVDMDDVARIRKDKLRDRLKEVASQNGYVIFSVPLEFYETYEKLCDGMSCWIDVVKITPQITSERELLEILARFWGFADDQDRLNLSIENLPDAVMYYKLKYREMLRKTYSVEFENLIVSDLDAGEEHEGLKKFTVLAIARKFGANSASAERKAVELLKNGVVQTEYDSGRFIADIRVGDREFYEVETFYGTGEPVSRKLLLADKSGHLGTLKKYEGMDVRVNVVVQPLHAILYRRKLREIEKLYKKHGKPEVKFYTPDLTAGNLRRI